MKKITITNALSKSFKERHSGTQDIFAEGMDREQDSQNYMDASDGYHTFTELYDHRIILYITLCRTFFELMCAASNSHTTKFENPIWRSAKHSDESSYDGWFILGINKEKGNQITYHLPMSKWEDTEFARTLDKAPEYDGHTSNDVLERIKNL